MSENERNHHITKDFTMAYNEVFRDDDLTVHEAMVYLAITHFASNDLGECWANQKTIGKAAKVSEDTVRRASRKLEEKGYLEISKKKLDGMRMSNVYKVLDVSRTREESIDGESTPRSEQGVHPDDVRSINTVKDINTNKEQSNISKDMLGASAGQRQKTLLGIDVPQQKKRVEKRTHRELGLEKINSARQKKISWSEVSYRDFTYYYIEQHNKKMRKELTFDRYSSVGIIRDNLIRAYDIPKDEVCKYIDNLLDIYSTSPNAWDSLTFNMIQKNIPLMKDLVQRVKVEVDMNDQETVNKKAEDKIKREWQWRMDNLDKLSADEIF